MELDIQRLLNAAIRQVVQRAIEESIGEETGAALPGEVRDEIKFEARRLCQEDPEIKEKIRKRLIHWIGEN